MYSTFNMGIGMMLIVNRDHESRSIDILRSEGVKACAIGEIVEYGDNRVVII